MYDVHVCTSIFAFHRLATKVFVGKLPAMVWMRVTMKCLKGIMGKQNSYMILIGVHLIMHLMHPNYVMYLYVLAMHNSMKFTSCVQKYKGIHTFATYTCMYMCTSFSMVNKRKYVRVCTS